MSSNEAIFALYETGKPKSRITRLERRRGTQIAAIDKFSVNLFMEGGDAYRGTAIKQNLPANIKDGKEKDGRHILCPVAPTT